MKGNLTAYFSNQLELLYHILKVQLFEDQNPFTKRLIIVPSQAIKSWLMFQLAEDPDLKIATGIEISYLDQGLKKIQEVLTKDPYPEFPDKLTLSFRIEDQLKSNIQEKTLGFLELKKYLHLLSKGDFSSPKSQRRLIHLADQLAYLFQNYAIYGKKMIQEWEEKPVCWQSYLWKSLKLINENPVITATGNFQIFVFAMSFIPFDHFLYFQKVAQKISVKFYQLSPSQPYWGDVLSDKESQWLLKKNLPQQKAWEVFLQDRNPLLANFGKLGRQMLLSFEKIGAEKFSRYFIPKSLENYSCLYEFDPNEIISIENHQPLNCLQAVQADILTIRNPQLHPKISFAQEDDSIQLHEASSKLKEVEILYDQIVSIIEKCYFSL